MGVQDAATTQQQLVGTAARATTNIFGQRLTTTSTSCPSPVIAQKTTIKQPAAENLTAFVVKDDYEQRAKKTYRDDKRKRSEDDDAYDCDAKEMQSEVGELQLDANVWKRVEYRKRARASGAQCFLEPLDPTMPLPPDLEPEHPKDGRPKRQRKELVRLDPEWTFADPEDDDDASDNHDDGYAPPKLRKKRPAASLRKEVRRTIAHEQPARNNTRRARKVDHGSRRLQVPEETPAVMSKPKSAPELSSEMPLKQFKWIEPILKPQQKTHCTDDDSNDDDMYVTIPERQLSTPPTRSPTSSPPYEPGPADVTERLLSSTLVVKNLSARKLYQSLRPIAEAWDKFNKIVTSSGGAMGKS